MIPKDVIILTLKRNDIDFSMRAKDGLNFADDALKRKDIPFARQIIDIIFSQSINSTQELQLICVLLSPDFFTREENRINLFFNLFDVGNRKLVLLKFIITAIAVGNASALNAAGTYLMDPQVKDLRLSIDLNRLLINEIIYFSNNSLEKLKALPVISPLFTNALCLIFAETFKDDQMPPKIITDLVTLSPTPFVFCFSIPTHIDTGAFILGAFLKWDVVSELFEEPYSYSKLHLKILTDMSSVEISSKPVVYTKYLEVIADIIQRSMLKVKDPERIQRSLEKFAQLLQVSKNYLYGNIPQLMEKLKSLPKNHLMELVVK